MRGGRRSSRIAAPQSNECHRCGERIDYWSEATKSRRGSWIHKRCASGADDE